jgi:hypothetical protein
VLIQNGASLLETSSKKIAEDKDTNTKQTNKKQKTKTQ